MSANWEARYGSGAPEIPGSVESFLSHRSVRRYKNEPIPESEIELLVAAAQSAATSSNLQSWSIISVQDPEKRAEISRMAGNQKQIVTCSWFFAFIADLNRAQNLATKFGEPGTGLDTIELYTVAIIDAALAAERMVCAAEARGYGICYIGSLRNDPEGVKNLLGLPARTMGAFGLCLGVPDESYGESIKPRLRQDKVWFKETYTPVLETDEYDARARFL